MSIIKVGNKLLVNSSRLFVPEGEEVYIEFSLPQAELPLKVKVVFTSEEGEDRKSSISVQGKAQHAVITFCNWSSAMDATMQRPLSFAESQDGDTVFFIASAKKSRKVYCLDIQFLLQVAEEEDSVTTLETAEGFTDE